MKLSEVKNVAKTLDAMLEKLERLQKGIDDVRKSGEALDEELEQIGNAIDDLIVRVKVVAT